MIFILGFVLGVLFSALALYILGIVFVEHEKKVGEDDRQDYMKTEEDAEWIDK